MAASESRNEGQEKKKTTHHKTKLVMLFISSVCQKVINLRTHQRFTKEMLNTEYYLV